MTDETIAAAHSAPDKLQIVTLRHRERGGETRSSRWLRSAPRSLDLRPFGPGRMAPLARSAVRRALPAAV